MTDTSLDRPKLLFVLSGDHGELFNAVYFVMGTSLRAAFLMPPKLLTLNRPGFPYRAHGYSAVSDVLDVVDRERPDLVLFFSGYLYVINKILDTGSVEQMIGWCRDRNLALATSDPLLGLMARAEGETFEMPEGRRERLARHGAELTRVLQDAVHVYLAPSDFGAARQVSFYNSNIVLEPAALARCRNRLRRWGRINGAKDRWVFVLSPEDYGIQTTVHGPERFADWLLGRLKDAVAAGRQPILVAPQPCIAEIQGRTEAIEDLIALPACNYGLFMFLLYDAEYVFYWNIFSASIIARVLNRMPFFVFDRGHQAQVIKPYLEVGTRHFYPGAKLPMLDQAEELEPERLAALASRQEAEILAPTCANLAKSPGPEQVVADILQGRG